ncbi:MAG: BON domain-containing protein, partial [Betaproteobacteria bacterium]
MNPRELTTRRVHAALEREPRINIHRHPIRIESKDGAVTLEGEVADVAAKKLALEAAAATGGVRGVIDRLRVAPGEARGDGAVRDSFARMLLEQGEFRNCTIRVRTKER